MEVAEHVDSTKSGIQGSERLQKQINVGGFPVAHDIDVLCSDRSAVNDSGPTTHKDKLDG